MSQTKAMPGIQHGPCSGLSSDFHNLVSDGHGNLFPSPRVPAEYQTSVQEKLPLIIGSSAAGLVFLIAVVVIGIVCNR